jgi:hypothetical protein
MGFNNLLLFGLFRGAVPPGVDNSAPRTDVKAGATFLTEVGLDVEAGLEFPFDRAFRALLGAGAAPNTVLADAIGHGQKFNQGLREMKIHPKIFERYCAYPEYPTAEQGTGEF